jgi:glycosyltransferase involved in cell wall biosynthesis
LGPAELVSVYEGQRFLRGFTNVQNGDEIELTILMPCLNEAETIGVCIDKAFSYLARTGIRGEVLVADNCSTDNSRAISSEKNARTVLVEQSGYGAALRAGIAAARGHYVIMGDADDSYDFANLDDFVAKLRGGCDLVIGNRFRGGISPGAMPVLHRYLGSPLLGFIGRRFFNVEIGDFHCGLRGFDRSRIAELGLHTTGMEFASEMIIAASLRKYSITEVPTTLSKAGRSRKPHLRTWRDGWRHLRFLLIFSPRWLFIYPGIAFIALGLFGAAVLFRGKVEIANGVVIDIHTFLVASIAILVGLQSISFGLIARRFATTSGFLPQSERETTLFAGFSLERGLLLALVIGVAGIAGLFWAIYAWVSISFGPIEYPLVLRVLVLSLTAIAVAMQIASTSFFLSIIDLPVRGEPSAPRS